jgi:MFS family permease
LELILFRAFQGLALSLCLPSSVQLITRNIPTGTRRNIAFACLGASQPVGFSIGLVLGGFFVERVGWRYGWYIGAILVFIIFVISIFGVPNDRPRNAPITLKRLRTDIDWIGCLILSTSLGFYSYVFSVLAGNASNIVAPAPLTLLILATLLLPLFAIHIKRQERLNRVVIIPTTLWSNVHFTSLCLVVFLVWAVFQAVTFFMTVYFQSVLLLSPIPTSLRFLPMVITGALANFVSGNLVARVPANTLVICSAVISAISPLLMALVNTDASYWLSAFWTIALIPICADVLFTISNLIITQAFPDEMHGVAGGVFNTLSQIGSSVGLAITAVIAASVTAADHKDEGNDAAQLMDGYRAAFWACFAASLVALGTVGLGLRRIGKVGLKRE